MATYEWRGNCLIVHDSPLTHICKQQGDLVHVTRVNEQSGDELPPIYLRHHELPEPIRKEFEKYKQFNR